MYTAIRRTTALMGGAALFGLAVLACRPASAQASGRARSELRVAQAAVEKAREAARLATEEASQAGQRATDSGDIVNPNGDVRISEDQTVEGDVIAISGAARVDGKVKGNVVAIGGPILLAKGAEVAGDAVSFGGTITREPGATVGGSTLELPGAEGEKGAPEPAEQPPAQPVAEEPSAEPAEAPSDEEEAQPSAPARHRAEIVQFGQPVHVAADEFVDGGVVSMGGPVDINGEVKGDVVSMGGPVDIGGKIRGDVVVFGGPLSLDDGAEVRGDAVTVGGPVKTADGAKVTGQTITLGGPLGGVPWGVLGKLAGQRGPSIRSGQLLNPWLRMLGEAAAWLGQALVMLIVVALVALAFPRQTETIATTIGQEPGRALLYGLVSWLLVLPILVILLVLIITWILIPIYLLVLFALLVVGYVGLAQFLGGRIVDLCNWRVTSLIGLTLVGFVALSLVDLVGFLPFVRYLTVIVTVLVLIVALGSALMTRFGTDPTGRWLSGRGARPSAAYSLPAVSEPAPAAGRVEHAPASDPAARAEDDLDDATRNALREVEEAGQPEPAKPSDERDEPPLDDLSEAAREALAELPPEEESKRSTAAPDEEGPKEPEA
jgi:cytoskeletal protein CcmA (bactofilin family)